MKYPPTEKQYKHLKRRSDILQYLEDWGVDDWEGYDDAMKAFHEDKDHADD